MTDGCWYWDWHWFGGGGGRGGIYRVEAGSPFLRGQLISLLLLFFKSLILIAGFGLND